MVKYCFSNLVLFLNLAFEKKSKFEIIINEVEKFDKNELNALIKLLDDTDPVVFDQISTRLVTLGKDVIPVLENVWGNSFDDMIQNRIETIIHQIQFDSLKSDLKKWIRTGSDNLLNGLLLVARYQYPDLDEGKVLDLLERLKESAVTETQMHQAPIEKTYALNRVMFEIFGFRGNTANFHSPQNSFINTVLETRKGNPLMLSSIYSIVANYAGMPVYGVNLPEHFVLAYQEKSKVQIYEYTHPAAGILFYINPFSRGTVFMKKDLDAFLQKLGLKPLRSFYEPCSNADIILRSFRNLSYSFKKNGENDRSAEIDDLLDAMEGES